MRPLTCCPQTLFSRRSKILIMMRGVSIQYDWEKQSIENIRSSPSLAWNWLDSLAGPGCEPVRALLFLLAPNYLTMFRWAWQSNRYVAIKVTNCFKGDRKSADEELQISQHISKVRSNHEGRSYIRLIRDSFKIRGPFGEHLCMVFEPLREPLWLLGRHLGSVGLPPTVLKAFVRLILQGLDFLHSECHIIHTGKRIDPGVLS